MARKIELKFYDNVYTIEYNRASIKEVFLHQSNDEIEQVITLIKGGLMLHHKDNMPNDDEIFGWVMALGEDVKPFAEALQGMVQEVLDAIQSDKKNLEWRAM